MKLQRGHGVRVEGFDCHATIVAGDDHNTYVVSIPDFASDRFGQEWRVAAEDFNAVVGFARTMVAVADAVADQLHRIQQGARQIANGILVEDTDRLARVPKPEPVDDGSDT